jgi:hypothetical protein
MNFNLLNPDTMKLAKPPIIFANLQLSFNPDQSRRIPIPQKSENIGLALLKLGLMQDID